MINIHKSSDGQYYFTVSAKNNKVIVTSETYKRKRSALKGIASIFTNFSDYRQVLSHPKVKDYTV